MSIGTLELLKETLRIDLSDFDEETIDHTLRDLAERGGAPYEPPRDFDDYMWPLDRLLDRTKTNRRRLRARLQ